MIDMWLSFKNSQPCPNAPDKTIMDVLEGRKRQNIDINTLDDLMLATEVKTIQRNGIRFLNCDYFDERLYGFKSKVLIKYNLFDLTSIKVFTPKDEYLNIQFSFSFKNFEISSSEQSIGTEQLILLSGRILIL